MRGAAAAAAAVAAAFCGGAAGGSGDAVLLAAGDIATCAKEHDEATAALVRARRGTVAALGDLAYESGTRGEFARCYGASWGAFRSRTRPAPGNHEYATDGAAGYFAYWGSRAGPKGKGYYSYDLGSWHVVVLNSNCHEVGGCHHGTPQARWLTRDLARSTARCTLAYAHHPRFSSGDHGDSEPLTPLWQILYAAGADVFLSGHDHDYERFAPQTPRGKLYRPRGIRQFVVGTGGRSLRPFERRAPNSEARNASTYGILRLVLGRDGYRWEFVPVPGSSFTDRGSGRCH